MVSKIEYGCVLELLIITFRIIIIHCQRFNLSVSSTPSSGTLSELQQAKTHTPNQIYSPQPPASPSTPVLIKIRVDIPQTKYLAINSTGEGVNKHNYLMIGGGALTQTPGVVTNVGIDGTVTETPVMITNTTGGAGGYGAGYGATGYGVGGVSGYQTGYAAGYGMGGVGATGYGVRTSQYGAGFGAGYGVGGITQTPAVVTNVTGGGLVTQTPVAVTNVATSGVGIGGYGAGLGVGMGAGYGAGNVTVIPSVAPASTSRVEYVPVQQSVTEYETREWVETIPRQQTLTEYQERRWTETVPREVSRIDHYAIEYLREYVPEVVATSSTQVIPQERFVQRTEYYPVQRQVNHGIQGMKQIGGVIGVGAAVNHQVVSVGVTQGETIVTAGSPMPPQVVGYTQGVATGAALGTSGIGYGARYGAGYGVGGMTQTPAVVTNVTGGLVTQTPAVVTNTGYGAGFGGSGVSGYRPGFGVGGVGVSGYQTGYGVGGVGFGGASQYGVGVGQFGVGASQYRTGYGVGGVTQTPGVVTNVGTDGTVYETPVVVTNTA